MIGRVLTAGVLALVAAGARAQQTTRTGMPGRGAPASAVRSSCPAPRPFIAPTSAQRRAARDLAERGQQAAILGDRSAAREQLRQAAALDPSDPDLAYQLARANDAAGAPADAAAEYCRFLALAPSAPEAAEARDRIAALAPPAAAAPPPSARFSPARALSLGLVLPGAGQFYTGRPVVGALSLGAAGAALACGLRQSTSLTSVQQTALDPFGNPYTYTSTRQTSSRPCLVPGLVAAGLIAVTTAVEASNYARHANEERRVAVDLVPDGATLSLRVSVR
jgi:hypothetical protein